MQLSAKDIETISTISTTNLSIPLPNVEILDILHQYAKEVAVKQIMTRDAHHRELVIKAVSIYTKNGGDGSKVDIYPVYVRRGIRLMGACGSDADLNLMSLYEREEKMAKDLKWLTWMNNVESPGRVGAAWF